MLVKKIHLQLREYILIFTCVGLIFGLPLYFVSVTNALNPWSTIFIYFLGSTVVGMGWLMPLMAFLANIMAVSTGNSLSAFPSSEFTDYLPWILPIISTVIIVKFSTNIPPWRTILYAHFIASGIGMIAILSFWPTFLT